MLLRRVTEHIKSQNWFAVGLDFFIVVFGVFIGFQVDRWNESRIEAAQENTYLMRLHTDMKTTSSRNENQIRFMMEQTVKARLVLESLNECKLAESDRTDFANGIYHLGKIFPPYVIKSTINELASTGKIDILKSSKLKAQLNQLIEVYENRVAIAPHIRERITPHIVYIDNLVMYHIESAQIGSTEVGWESVSINFEQLCTNARFKTAVSAVRNYTFDVIAQNRQVQQEVDSLIRLLEDDHI
jgi:hypothetical protein